MHPTGFRLGINKTWLSNWYAKRNYADLLHEDLMIRRHIKKRLYHAGISKVEIERAASRAKIQFYTAHPGIIIGKRGAEVDKLKNELQELTQKQVAINIKEIRKAEIDGQLVAENIALQLERRVAFRRAMKKAITSALRFGAKGIASSRRDVLLGRRWHGVNGIVKEGCRSTRCVLTSTMVSLRRRRLTARLGSKCGSIKGSSWLLTKKSLSCLNRARVDAAKEERLGHVDAEKNEIS